MNREEINNLEMRIRSGRIAYKELTVLALQLADTARITMDELQVYKDIMDVVEDEEE